MNTNEWREELESMELRILDQLWRLEDAVCTLCKDIRHLRLKETESPQKTDLRLKRRKESE